jgi:hypothetical protein
MNFLQCCSRPFLFAALLTAFAVLLGGCTSVQVSPNTVGSYELGELKVIAEGNIDRVYLAAKAAIEEDRLFLTGDTWRGISATLTARDELDTRVTVRLKQIEPGRTSVGIRYGLSGDLQAAQTLYSRMERRF